MDRLSSMPDNVLHHILSFLSTKEAAATCFLSTRWRHLWKIHPHIHIKLYCDIDPGPIQHVEANVSWVDSLLSSVGDHLVSLPEFSIKNEGFIYDQFVPHIERWISFALQKNVVVLNLEELPFGQYGPSYRFPPPYPNETRKLMHLSLNNCVLRPTFGGFSNLKSLSLRDSFVSDAAFESITLNCCKLEVLVVRRLEGLQNITLTSSLYLLKHLEISGCFLLEHVSIESPNLTTLEYHGQNHIQPSLILKQAPRLRDVSLSLYREEGTLSNIVALLRGNHTSIIGRIEKLSMELEQNPCHMDDCSNLYLLKDVKELSLSVPGHNLMIGLGVILRGFSRLESLSLVMGAGFMYSGAMPPWRRDEQWRHKRLRMIEIREFYCIESEFLVLEYLVETSPALEEVVIVPRSTEAEVATMEDSWRLLKICNKPRSGVKLTIWQPYPPYPYPTYQTSPSPSP